jgi:hypothetical protein
VTAPAARTLAEIVEEGRRLEAERDTPFRQTEPGSELERIVLSYRERKQHLLDVHYTMHGPALLAVAEAAVEWEAADAEQRRVPAWSRDTDLFERMLFRYQSATRALRAAVRGEEKTS